MNWESKSVAAAPTERQGTGIFLQVGHGILR